MTEDIDLNPTDNAILDMLGGGRCTPSYIADEHGYSRGNVKNRMDRLVEHKYVDRIHRGLYELVDDPREDAEDEADLRARLQDALEAKDDAQATAERLRDELDDCQDRLADARERSDVDVDGLRRAIEDAEAAAERGDGTALQDALDRAKEATDQ